MRQQHVESFDDTSCCRMKWTANELYVQLNCKKHAANMAYRMRKGRNPSIFKAIMNRQIYGANVQLDIRMITTMIASGRSFKRVYEVTSNSPIFYHGDRLYSHSFAICHNISNVKTNSMKPKIVYSLPQRPSSATRTDKIRGMLVFECPLDQTTFMKVQGTFYANGPYSIGVTENNYLKIFDFKTGKTLKQVYLSPHCKFRYINWETGCDRIVLQSTLLPQTSSAHVMRRVPVETDPVLLYVAIFGVIPLEFICMLPISYRIFGVDICNVNVWNGMLIVMNRKRKLQFFSLEDILTNHTIPLKLGEYIKPGNDLCLPQMDEFASGTIGMSPLGLPVNVCLVEKPSVLFEVVSSIDSISLGGYPWHYVAEVDQVFNVRSVKDHTLVENGILSSDDDMSYGTEHASFHADLSGRILHITSSFLRCLRIDHVRSDSGNTTHVLQEQFILDYCQQTKKPSNVRTKSGRMVKQLIDSNQMYLEREIIQDFDYDDELNLFVVLYLNPMRPDHGVVSFYDNQTGQHIHDLDISGISEHFDYSVAINRNLLVISSKSLKCLVYHMV